MSDAFESWMATTDIPVAFVKFVKAGWQASTTASAERIQQLEDDLRHSIDIEQKSAELGKRVVELEAERERVMALVERWRKPARNYRGDMGDNGTDSIIDESYDATKLRCAKELESTLGGPK